jgi:integrase
VQRLVDAAKDDRLGALWTLAAMVGLRKGEALALTWNDVVDAAEVTVRGSLGRASR